MSEIGLAGLRSAMTAPRRDQRRGSVPTAEQQSEVDAAWERYRQAVLRHQESAAQLAEAKQEFERLFLA